MYTRIQTLKADHAAFFFDKRSLQDDERDQGLRERLPSFCRRCKNTAMALGGRLRGACAAMLSPSETAPRLTADAVIEITGRRVSRGPERGISAQRAIPSS